MPDDIVRHARELGLDAECYRFTSQEMSVEFENNRLKRAETIERAGLAVRVIRGGRIGFATSSLPADESELLDRASALALHGKEAKFAFPPASEVREVATQDRSVTSLTPEELVACGEELIEPLRAEEGFKAGVALAAAEVHTALSNTSGFEGEVDKTYFGGSVGGILVEGENFLELQEGYYSCRRTDALRGLRGRVLDYLRHGRRNASLQSGSYRVLFTPPALASLLRPLLACINGKAVEKEISPLRGRLGEKMFSESITLHDDPLMPYYPSTSPFDGEGIPGRSTSLIERGVLRDFLLDLDTASALGMSPNGTGRRGGWTSPPRPGASTLVLDGGAAPSERLLSDMEEGLLVHSLLGAGMGNPYGGVVSGNLMLGFLVRRGEIVGRVKNTMLALNIFDLLRSQLAGLSSDREDVWGSILLPYLLADGASITAKR